MAEIRFIQTSFWGDSYILDLTPEEKLIYLYLLSNSKTSQCGAYEIPPKTIEYETGLIREVVARVLERFQSSGKILFDRSTNEIMLLNWFRHNNPGAPGVKMRAIKDASAIRSKIIFEKVKELLIENGYCTSDAFKTQRLDPPPGGTQPECNPNATPMQPQCNPDATPVASEWNSRIKETDPQKTENPVPEPFPNATPMQPQCNPNATPVASRVHAPACGKGIGMDKGKGIGNGNEDLGESDFSESEKSSPPPSTANDDSKGRNSMKPHERIKVDKETFRFTGILPEDIDRWKEAYPAVDIPYQLGKMELWVAGNPSQFKSNWFRFINNWLAREQERGGARQKGQEQIVNHQQKTFAQMRTEQTSEAGKAALEEIFGKGDPYGSINV